MQHHLRGICILGLCMLQNPTKSSPPNQGLGRDQKVEYPPELLKEFEGTPGGYAWMSPKNPALLDYLGAEFILIGADPDIGAYISQGYYQASAKEQQSRLRGVIAGWHQDLLYTVC